MSRKLLNFGLAWCLLLGCWGGVLAGVVCPHEPCHAASDAAAGRGGHSSAGGGEDHSEHAQTHEGHAEEPTHDAAESWHASRGHDPRCAHCVGGPEVPPAAKFEWQSGTFKKGAGDAATHAPLRLASPAAPPAREIIPAQHAPPGNSDRQLLLLNVFRI